MAALAKDPIVRMLERLLAPPARPAARSRPTAAAAPSPDLAAALDLGNQIISAADLAAVLLRLSDDAWEQLGALRCSVADDYRSRGTAASPFAQLFAMPDAVWHALEGFRAQHRAAEKRRDGAIAALALDAARVALTPPVQQVVTPGPTDESSPPSPPALAAAERAVAEDRARTFLHNYRRVRAEAAATNPALRTQKQLAAAAGVSAATINAIETGKVLPQLGTIVKLAKALGVDAQSLISSR